MLIRFANNPGTTLGEQDFLRSLPDSVDFVVLTNADNLSVYDKEDISKLKRTGTKFLYYKNLSEFYDQCEETENLEEFKTKMNAALKNGEPRKFFTGSSSIAISKKASTFPSASKPLRVRAAQR